MFIHALVTSTLDYCNTLCRYAPLGEDRDVYMDFLIIPHELINYLLLCWIFFLTYLSTQCSSTCFSIV